jgi:hypothetical protein
MFLLSKHAEFRGEPFLIACVLFVLSVAASRLPRFASYGAVLLCVSVPTLAFSGYWKGALSGRVLIFETAVLGMVLVYVLRHLSGKSTAVARSLEPEE